jgi:hypothetical protein
VRVFFGFAFGVVLAVNGRPSLGGHAGGQPQPKAKEMGGQPVQIQGAVGLVTVQINGDRSDGDVRHPQGDEDQLPSAEVPDPIGQPIQQRIQPRPSGQQHVNPPNSKNPF